jgi:CRP-like cAMP-binding protein
MLWFPVPLPCTTRLLEQAKRKDERMKLPNIFEKETTPATYAAGSVIFKEGETRDSMYVVKTGEVDLLVSGELVETVVEDGFFGEMALVDHEPRSATAVAKTDCSLIAINEKQFLFMVQETPFFAIMVTRTLAARLRKRNMVFTPPT